MSAILCATAAAGPALSKDVPPTCATNLLRALDFRIGSFRGVTATGQFAGTTDVRPDADGCALIEHWKGAMGGNGVGLFFYDRMQGAWRFTYINADGETLTLIGIADAEGVTFTDENHFYDFQGLHQMRWERAPHGAVRQVWKLSTDQGKTWRSVVEMMLSPAS